MIKNSKTLAVIIPAHNEADAISGCIESLLNQTVIPNEIIVICNACTDNTAKIASRFKGVKVIETSKKGLINARNMGFDLAKSEILARINADVVCRPDWCSRIINDFSDKEVIAVAGLAKNKTLLGRPYLFTKFWSKIYLLFSESYFGVPILWGANMALSKKAWLIIKNDVCFKDSEVHEDQDLSIHLSNIKGIVISDSDCIVVSGETSYFDWPKFKQYNSLRINTKKIHKDILTARDNRLSFMSRIYRFTISIIPSLIFFSVSFLNYSIIRLLRSLSGRHL